MNVVSVAVMQEIEQQTETVYALSPAMLMERAGLEIWNYIAHNESALNAIVILVGKGNNGGDGLVVARHAAECRKAVTIIDANVEHTKCSPLMRANYKICSALQIPIMKWHTQKERCEQAIAHAGVLVDGLVGIGATGALRPALHALVRCVNASSARMYAIDIPSGLSESYQAEYAVVKSDITLTLGLPKRMLFYPQQRLCCGNIVCLKIGFPQQLLHNAEGGQLLDDTYVCGESTPIPPLVYKHTRGVVAILAGSPTYSGAALLAADAAAAAGAGLIHIHTNPELARHYAAIRPAYIVSATSHSHTQTRTCYCIGPGWGTSQQNSTTLLEIINQDAKGVIDADGINILSNYLSFAENTLHIKDGLFQSASSLQGWILTPHIAEFARLINVQKQHVLQDPLRYLRVCAQRLAAVIILKSYVTFVMNSDGRYCILDGAEPSLATGGSGDILSGIIAALYARGGDPFHIAQQAVCLHHAVGTEGAQRFGMYRAEQLIPILAKKIHASSK